MSKCKYEILKGRGAKKIEELMEKWNKKENYNLSAYQEGEGTGLSTWTAPLHGNYPIFLPLTELPVQNLESSCI